MKHKSTLFLKELNKNMVTKEYVSWLNDHETMRYTEQRFLKHDMMTVKNYVNNIKRSNTEFLFGIFINRLEKKIHIGNIKLGPINKYHKNAYISFFIGNKRFLNMGYGTNAIKEVLIIAKKKYKLNKIYAGAYSLNKQSIKILKKNKFVLEGNFKKAVKFNEKFINHFIFGKIL